MSRRKSDFAVCRATVDDLMQNLADAITHYVMDDEGSAVHSVSSVLRTLLTDLDGVRSWSIEGSNLLDAVYGPDLYVRRYDIGSLHYPIAVCGRVGMFIRSTARGRPYISLEELLESRIVSDPASPLFRMSASQVIARVANSKTTHVLSEPNPLYNVGWGKRDGRIVYSDEAFTIETGVRILHTRRGTDRRSGYLFLDRIGPLLSFVESWKNQHSGKRVLRGGNLIDEHPIDFESAIHITVGRGGADK